MRIGTAVLVALALPLGGCQRGCLVSWLDAHGGLGVAPGVPRSPEAPRGVPRNDLGLAGVDCPDGLARCVAGTVEVSRVGAVAARCRGVSGGCICPWDAVASCAAGCVAEGVEVVMAEASAATQLCAPGRGEAVLRPPPAGSVKGTDGCDDAAFKCVGATVFRCSQATEGPNGAVAVCVHGCVADGATVDEPLGDEKAALLLCLRPTAGDR